MPAVHDASITATSLTPAGTFATGGAGLAGVGGRQGAVELSDDEETVYAINAGSNSVTAFRVRGDRRHAGPALEVSTTAGHAGPALEVSTTAASGGVAPASTRTAIASTCSTPAARRT